MRHQTAPVKKSHARFSFIGEIISELKKVVWLSRREAVYLTFLVLIISIAAGLILGAVDFGFASLIDRLFLGRW